jgi:hypothetical protein
VFFTKIASKQPLLKARWIYKIETFLGTSNHKILYLAYMSTCPPNLSYSFFTIYEIITFKVEEKVFFSSIWRRQQCFGTQKNHFLDYMWNEPLCILVLGWVRYMSTKSHTHSRCGTFRKSSISTRGNAEIHIQGRLLTIKIAYEKFFDWKSKRWKHALVPLRYAKNLFLKNTKISIFGSISKFHLWADSSKFSQFGVVLESFGQILLHLQWLRACPKQGWNL